MILETVCVYNIDSFRKRNLSFFKFVDYVKEQNMYVHLFQGADEMTSSAMEETLTNANLDPLVSALSMKFACEEKMPIKKK